jgi:tetratricopeptide (TPR) repeat protein
MIDQAAALIQMTPQAVLPGGNGAPAEISAREFERLALLLGHAERGAWAFCVYNVAAVRDAIVDQLRARLNPLPIYEFTLSAEQPNPRGYLERLPADAMGDRAVIVFYDAWRAFDAGFLGYLDLQREQFWRAPHSLIFWIREADRALLARHALNFFSRHSGVFDFQVVIPFQAEMVRSLSAALPATWDSVAERERLERLYIGLLHEYESDSEPDQATIADLLGKLASIWYYSDRFDQAGAAQRRRLELARQLGDRQIEAESRLQIGQIHQLQADLAAAGEQYRAALADFQAIGERLGAANTRLALGDLALRQADLAAAGEQYRAALADFQAIGERLGAANTRLALGDLALRQADLAAAGEQYRAALADFQAIGERLGAANTKSSMGKLALIEGRKAEADQLLAEAIAIYRAIGSRYSVPAAIGNFGWTLLRIGRTTEARPYLLQAAELFDEIGFHDYAARHRRVAGA